MSMVIDILIAVVTIATVVIFVAGVVAEGINLVRELRKNKF